MLPAVLAALGVRIGTYVSDGERSARAGDRAMDGAALQIVQSVLLSGEWGRRLAGLLCSPKAALVIKETNRAWHFRDWSSMGRRS